jgi:LysR family nitrogen assimilation transcriptional regulator
MDIRQLRYFVAIMEEGSLSRASARLGIAQPALSFHIRNMEAELGTPLLLRTSKGVTGTEEGQILLRNARFIIGQLEQAEQEIRGRAAEPEGEVRLGLPGTISQILSVPLIKAVNQRHPAVKLRIAEAMSGFLGNWLEDDRIDMAVLYMPPPARFISTCVLSEELCLLGPTDAGAGVRLSARAVPSLERIFRLPLILPSGSHGLRQLLENIAAEHGLAIETTIDVDSYSSIKELVEHGLGFSILPVNAVHVDAREGRLRMWPLKRPQLTRNIHIVVPADRPLRAAVRAVQSLCQEVLVDLVRTGKWQGARVTLPPSP